METRKKEILEEMKEAFDKSKKELGFKASFDDLEEAFSIKDGVLQHGFVGEKFSRQIEIGKLTNP